VELRTLSETGAIGALIALLGLICSLIAGNRVLRGGEGAGRGALAGGDALARVAAAGALAGFAYWAIHGSFDWFFEYAGLGAAAFALLGLVCSLCPADLAASEEARVHGEAPALVPRRSLAGVARLAAILGVSVLALAAAVSLALPWLSRSEVQSAAKVWSATPKVAYSRLREAARLNPLSDEPYLVSGSIALRFGDLRRADRQFELALQRVPGDAYATLERGAIASSLGERQRALALLRRAAHLNPRDPITRRALAQAKRGQRVNVTELNREILREAQHFS